MYVKMRTTRTWTLRPYEASLFLGIGFGLFLRSLGGRRRRPPFGGPKPSVGYHSRRARILTLCQRPMDQGTVSMGVGLPKGNGGMQRFPRARRRLTLQCKDKRELDCKNHPLSRDVKICVH
ncbi:hypothetical protein ES332_D11G353600v1 [Gossypium tomentosum]|uniref:Uncharacterized protein n=1 Tax=Gossypium tomentosum TaxID=34277 RepID=A0A5D2IVF6_GOSTO|nr:hypothetical protein ES332_D11G353600v1 [Gossypium tomentosum]